MAKKNNTGDLITHCNAVRARIMGEGDLVATIYDSSTPPVIALLANGILVADANKSVTQLANFKAERVAYEIRVTEIDDWFFVNNMYAYVKKTAASYPQL